MTDLEDLRLSVLSTLIEVYDNASPICRKINQGIEKNGVEDENLYHIPRDLVQDMFDNMLEKLDRQDLYLLDDFLQVLEASTIRTFCEPQQVKDYIKGKVEQITEIWEESISNVEE